MQFLMDSGYEYPISSKSLTRPSAKEFTNIVTFMLRQIDRDFGRGGTMKFEDEVALNFKCLGYPLTISKTSIVAAGSPHTWPALLAALTWLMEQILIQNARIQVNELENTTSTFDSLQELDDKTNKAFFQYLGQAYRAFMQGDAMATEKLEVELQQKFERDDDQLHQSVDRITDLNATILVRIDEITQQAQEYVLYLSSIVLT
jgi:kinetochore protein NDC80